MPSPLAYSGMRPASGPMSSLRQPAGMAMVKSLPRMTSYGVSAFLSAPTAGAATASTARARRVHRIVVFIAVPFQAVAFILSAAR